MSYCKSDQHEGPLNLDCRLVVASALHITRSRCRRIASTHYAVRAWPPNSTRPSAGQLAGLMELMELKDGDVLVREGTSDDHLFVVVSGALGVVRHPEGEPPVRFAYPGAGGPGGRTVVHRWHRTLCVAPGGRADARDVTATPRARVTAEIGSARSSIGRCARSSAPPTRSSGGCRASRSNWPTTSTSSTVATDRGPRGSRGARRLAA